MGQGLGIEAIGVAALGLGLVKGRVGVADQLGGALGVVGEQAIGTLEQLKRLGVALSIDDFGTGYSSLAYLKRFAVDKLKIDQSFIRDIPHDNNDKEIAATIIAMARNLKLHVLAEGVETQEQLAFLQLHGCDAFQGYLYSPPVPATEFVQFLTRAMDS
jgi:EAL domain-containing protein (putative c-di-GMP-specific phosphodiesterase class I)